MIPPTALQPTDDAFRSGSPRASSGGLALSQKTTHDRRTLDTDVGASLHADRQLASRLPVASIRRRRRALTMNIGSRPATGLLVDAARSATWLAAGS